MNWQLYVSGSISSEIQKFMLDLNFPCANGGHLFSKKSNIREKYGRGIN